MTGNIARIGVALALMVGLAPAPAQAQEAPEVPVTRSAAPLMAPTVSLLVPALAYAAMPLTGGTSALVAPALAGGGHMVAGAPGRGLASGLVSGALTLGAYGAGARWLGAGGHAAGVQAAVILGVPLVVLTALDAYHEASRRAIVDPPPEPPLGPVTRRHYERLQGGMTLDEAVAVLGRPGFRVDRSKTLGLATETWRWTNPDGSYLEVSFQAGRSVGKAQRGLPAR